MRLSRAEIFDPSEIVAVHAMARTNRRCFLLGQDPLSGKNFDHRKRWLEDKLPLLASAFGIDLLAFTCLSDHIHLVLRSRPDFVQTWDDTEVARRWWTLCPRRRTGEEEQGDTALCFLGIEISREDKTLVSRFRALICSSKYSRSNFSRSKMGATSTGV